MVQRSDGNHRIYTPAWGRLLGLLGLAGLAGLAGGCGDSGVAQGGVVQIDVQPTDTIVFTQVSVGQELDYEITISSFGAKDVVVREIAFEPEADEFKLQHTFSLPLTIEKGRPRSFRVVYSPQESGTSPETTLVIRSNDKKLPEARIAVSVLADLPVLERSPTLLKWGYDDPRAVNQGCQETLNRKDFVLSNGGSGLLVIDGHRLVGKDLPDGELAGDHFSVCPAATWEQPLDYDSQTWTVVFHPKTAGMKKATLTIQSNGGNKDIELIGGGEGQSRLEVTPLVLSWPELQQGQSGVKHVELVNTGSLPVDVQQLRIQPSTKRPFYSISGDTFVAGEDQASGRLSQPIPKNGSVRLEITYTASQPEPVVATLEIAHTADSPPSPVIVDLMGNTTAPQLLIEPPQVEFSGVGVGVSDTRTFVLRNAGNAPLEVSGVEIAADGEALGFENFSCHPEPCSATLGPDEFRAFEITYHRPLDATQREDRGCANILSNDPARQPAACLSLHASNLDGNLPPSACIASEPADPTTAVVGSPVTLSCACSADPDAGQAISRCRWMLAHWPAGSRAALTVVDGDPARPTTLTPDVAGTYRVVLVVTDDSLTQFVSPEEDLEIVAR